MNKFYYAGIGSRKLTRPAYPEIWQSIEKLVGILKPHGILRSGGADGADSAFEEAAYYHWADREIYVPWDGFNGRWSTQDDGVTANLLYYEDAEAIAQRFHPNWRGLSPGAKKMMVRNTYQVLGKDLETPSAFVLCWTPNGEPIGGTSQALRIAEYHKIPIYNLGNSSTKVQDILDWISG